ncbi:MAG: SDR family NAD(P)-dependent oxidoreductase [Peptoanaerobacter stomatis]
MKNIGIVTGASSGLGKGIAIEIAKGFDIDELWLIARRKERLVELGKEIYEDYGVNVVIMSLDLIDEKSLQKISERLESQKPNIKILVNSSGFGVMGDSSEMNRKVQEDMILLNCKALFSLTNICTNYMSRGSGILQIASVAGFCPQPYFAVYSATKAFVLSYSMALSKELKKRGISVSALCPGPVNTEFFDICERDAKMENMIKKMFIKSPNFVVKRAIKGYLKKKTVIVPGITMKLLSIIEGLYIKQLSSILAYKIYKKFN